MRLRALAGTHKAAIMRAEQLAGGETQAYLLIGCPTSADRNSGKSAMLPPLAAQAGRRKCKITDFTDQTDQLPEAAAVCGLVGLPGRAQITSRI
jgi:hypothetical protein